MPKDFDDLFVKAVAASIDKIVDGGKRARILIALSGGPDSTALLLATHRLLEKSGQLVFEAAHVNHRLRGKDSDEDEAFCRELCASLKIPLRVYQDDSADSTSSENALRARRYAFLQEEALAGHFHAVMTAHTANDQAETLLFRLIRGTSLKGLGGIKPCRNLVRDVLLLRPFLDLSRAAVLAFLSGLEVTACEDLSNSQMRYSRNYIRHMVMTPIEERFNGGIARIAGFAAKAAADNDFLEQQANSIFDRLYLCRDLWKVDDVRNLHQSLLARILARALQQRAIEIGSARIDALQMVIARRIDERISMDATWDVLTEGNRLQWLRKHENQTSQTLLDFELVVKIPGLTPIANISKVLVVEIVEVDSPFLKRTFPAARALEALVDLSHFLDVSSFPIILRRRRVGDFIRPLGMSQNVRLKKYLHTKKASSQIAILEDSLEPGFLVSHCILLASGSEVLWVPGIGLSEHVKVKENSAPTHRLSIIDLPEEMRAILKI